MAGWRADGVRLCSNPADGGTFTARARSAVSRATLKKWLVQSPAASVVAFPPKRDRHHSVALQETTTRSDIQQISLALSARHPRGVKKWLGRLIDVGVAMVP